MGTGFGFWDGDLNGRKEAQNSQKGRDTEGWSNLVKVFFGQVKVGVRWTGWTRWTAWTKTNRARSSRVSGDWPGASRAEANRQIWTLNFSGTP